MNLRTKTYILPAALALLLMLPACGVGPDRQIVPTAGPTTLGPVPGDRDDVQRALQIGLEAAQAALLEGAWRGDTYTASFLAIESREGVASAAVQGEGQLRLSAYIGPAGDQQAQERLLNAWARRLEQLHGVEWAPR